MLQEDFVPVAFDQWYQRRQDDAEGKFYQRIAKQGPRNDLNSTTQGFYIATAGGELLQFNNNRGPKRIRSLMKKVLAENKKWLAKPINGTETDSSYPDQLPEGAIVVQVNSKVLGGYARPRDQWKALMHKSIGRDNLWIMSTEVAALLDGRFPDSLAEKIARFHLMDNTRGEAPMWTEKQVKRIEFHLDKEGNIGGRVELETGDASRAYSADLFGKLESVDGVITRFDLVAKGNFRGEGRWTPGAPEGDFPLAVAFRLADKSDIAYSVRPQAIKAFGRGYLEFGRK